MLQSLARAGTPQWYRVLQLGKGYQFTHCAFYDTNNGWAVGSYIQPGASNHIAMTTTDGGSTWTALQNVPSGTYAFSSVFLTAPNEAWLTDNAGYVYHCTLNGTRENWDQPQKLAQYSLNDIYMTGSTSGFAVDSNAIYSYQGGGLWVSTPIPLDGGTYSGISFSKDNHFGVAVGQNTTNGTSTGEAIIYYGGNWSVSSFGQNTYPALRKVSFAGSSSSVFAVGSNGTIIQSGNFGQSGTWMLKNNGASDGGNFIDVYFVDQNNGWVSGTNEVYSTNNGGNSWTKNILSSSGIPPIFGVFAIDTNHAWAVGGNGSIYVYAPNVPPSLLPASLEVTVVNTFESVGLSWAPAAGATSYQVYRSLKSNASGVNQGKLALNDDFSSDLSKWTTVATNGAYNIAINSGKLEVSGTSQLTSKPDAPDMAGVYAPNVLADTSKLIELSADVDLSHGADYPVYACPLIMSLNFESGGLLSFLEKADLSHYAVGLWTVSGEKTQPTILDPNTVSSGTLKTLWFNNYASLIYNGTYQGKIAADHSGTLYYGLLGITLSPNISMDIFFDNFKAIEYPVTSVAFLAASATSFIDTSVLTGETYFYSVVPVNDAGVSGSNIVEVTVTSTRSATAVTPTIVNGVASFQGGEISLMIHSNGSITISSNATSSTPISIAIYGTNWSDKLDIASATSVKQSQTGDIQIKWQPTGKIASLDKGIYPAILKVGSLNQKIYLIKY